jgi:hypothetical protein
MWSIEPNLEIAFLQFGLSSRRTTDDITDNYLCPNQHSSTTKEEVQCTTRPYEIVNEGQQNKNDMSVRDVEVILKTSFILWGFHR